jgi:integrase
LGSFAGDPFGGRTVASIYQSEKTGIYQIMFRLGKKQFHKNLDTDQKRKANSIKATVEETIHDIKRGRLTMPEGADPWEFLRSGGKVTQKFELAKQHTLSELFALYQEKLPPGSMEANSMVTMKIHLKHLVGILGKRTVAQGVGVKDMQDYVNERAKHKHHGQLIKAQTIKKEVATFRAVWNWAMDHGYLTGWAPTKGLRHEKSKAKPPFQTSTEIEKKVKRGGLGPLEQKELWNALFLDTKQIEEVLAYAENNALHRFIHPMFVFVAHTGARRSEMMRSRVEDIDFEGGVVHLREKKKDRSVEMTFRKVPMSANLQQVLKTWLAEYPGGQFTFCKEENVPLTANESEHYFSNTLDGSKWDVLRGFHVFRHSFASNLASKGVDQRLIDEFMGHTTDDMQKRYRHLFPEQQKEAVMKLFGKGQYQPCVERVRAAVVAHVGGLPSQSM